MVLASEGSLAKQAYQVACPKMNGHRGSVSSKKVEPSLPRAFGED